MSVDTSSSDSVTESLSPTSQPRDILDFMMGAFTSSSYKIRKDTMTELVRLVKEFIDDDTEKEALFSSLAKLIFATGSTWVDGRSRKLVDAALFELAQELGAKFVFPFLNAYVARLPAKLTSTDVYVLEKWINWSFQILTGYAACTTTSSDDKNVQMEENKATITLYVGSLIHLIEKVLNGKPSDAEDRIAKVFAQVISAFPLIAEEYLRIAKGTKSFAATYTPIYTLFHAFNIAYNNSALKDKVIAAWTRTKKVILAQYTTEITNSVAVPKTKLVTLFAFIFPFLTSEDLAGAGGAEILTSITRGLRRAPQVVFIPCIETFKALQPNLLAPFITDLLPPLMNELRNATDATRRSKAKEVLMSVSQNIADPASRALIVTALDNNLLGKNGVSAVTAVDVRLSLADAVAAFAKGTDTATLAACCDTLLALAAKEQVIVNKDHVYSAIASACSGAAAPANVLAAFSKAILDTDATQTVYAASGVIRGIADLLTSPTSASEDLQRAVTSPAVEAKLLQLIETCSVRPAMRVLGMSAFLILALASGEQIDIHDTTKQLSGAAARPLPTSLVAYVTSASFISDVAFYSSASLSPSDASVGMTLLSTLLTRHTALFLSSLPALTAAITSPSDTAVVPTLAVYQALLALTTSSHTTTRRTAFAFVSRLLTHPHASPLGAGFLFALRQHVFAQEQAQIDVLPPAPVAGEEEEPVYVASWDGEDTFLSIRRIVPARTTAVVAHTKRDALRGPMPVTQATASLASLLVTFTKKVTPATLALAISLAAHPLLACNPDNALATLAAVSHAIAKATGVNPAPKTPVAIVPLPSLDASPAAQALITDLLFGEAAWLTSASTYHTRAAINLLAYLAVAAPKTFSVCLIPKIMVTLNNKAFFNLSPYRIAVYQTPAWSLCDMPDPEETRKPRVVEDKNVKVDKKSGYTKAELEEMRKKKEEEEKMKLLAAGTQSQQQKEATIRAEVHRIVLPIINTLTALEAVSITAPAVAHNDMLLPLLPLLHQYILGLALPHARAGLSCTEQSDMPKPPAFDEVPTAGVVPLARDAARSLLSALARTLDLHISHDVHFLLTAADVIAAVWEKPADSFFATVAAAVHGDKAALAAAAVDDRVGVVVALSKALEYLAEQVQDNALSAPSFSFLLPALDAILRFSPIVAEAAEEEEEEDAQDAEEDVNEVTTMVHNYKYTLIDTLAQATNSAATILSTHCAAAAAAAVKQQQQQQRKGLTDENVHHATNFPLNSMVNLLLVALARVTTSDVRDTLHNGLVRLAYALTLPHIHLLLSTSGIFAPAAHVRVASLDALARTQILLAAPALFLSAQMGAEDEDRMALAAEAKACLAEVATKVYTLIYDKNEEVVAAARRAYTALKLEDVISSANADISSAVTRQVELVAHPSQGIRQAAAGAIAALLGEHKKADLIVAAMVELTVLFTSHKDYTIKKQSAREKDRFIDRSDIRISVCHAVMAIAPLVNTAETFPAFFRFFLHTAFADENGDVWEAALQAAVKAIHLHGAEHTSFLSSLLKEALDKPVAGASARAVESLKEGAVLLLGTLARYFRVGSKELTEVFTILLKTLDSPSLSVQRAVSQNLVSIVPALPQAKEAMEGKNTPFFDGIVAQMLTNLSSPSYATRTGAAAGLAAVMFGLRGRAMVLYNILPQLSEMTKSKSSATVHGALCCFEALFDFLGPIIAPYITDLLQTILPCYGSADAMVRQATQAAAASMTRHLNRTGVRVLLPILLAGLKDRAWRTKVESIQMLSSMAALAPRELALCLPLIVPRLLDAITDPNDKVEAAARSAIRTISAAVKNPEIRKIVALLVAALIERSPATVQSALSTLYTTVFHHYIDPASLALIIPIVRGGLRERDASVKKTAVQIAGSVAQIVTDPKDLAPYTDNLVRPLKSLLMDSMPDVRQVTARAIGAMSTGSLSDSFTDLLQLLLDILSQKEVRVPANTDQSVWAHYGTTSAQRSGSALGAAQLLLGRGIEAAEKVLDETIVPSLEDERPTVREGYLGLLYTLPAAFGQQYAPLVIKTFPVVLGCFSDSYAVCREFAVKAGQQLVINFAKQQTQVIMASIMEALLDADYRVRQGALQLSANFLLRLAGLSGEIVFADTEDDNSQLPQTVIRERMAVSTEAQERLIMEALTQEQRDELMTSIYLLRSDVIDHVSSIAWRVWKATVPSSARMLQQILPCLVERITSDLASWNDQRQQTAANALNELVSKLGDRILRDIVPILLDKLTAPEVHTRKGVCLGIAEICSAASKSILSNYLADFIPSLASALCDINDGVRVAARKAYEALVRTCGERIVRETIPLLLQYIDEKRAKYHTTIANMRTQGYSESDISEEKDYSEFAVLGLREAVSVHMHERLAIEPIVAHLLATPIDPFHVSVLSRISAACGRSFLSHLGKVTDTLHGALYNVYRDLFALQDAAEEDTSAADAETVAKLKAQEAELITSAMDVVAGLGLSHQPTILESLLQGVRQTMDESVATHVAAIKLLGAFWKASSATEDDIGLLNDPIGALLPLLLSDYDAITAAAAEALENLFNGFHGDVLIKYIGFIRSKFNDMTGKKKKGGREITEIHGLGQGNLVGVMLTFFQHGLVTGSPNIRLQAGAGIADLVELAPADALKPHVMKLTGFLIRSFGDRLAVEVRATILQALGGLMQKNAAQLKAFQSQLKTSMLKALYDEAPVICERAAIALATMPKPETFIAELQAAAEKQSATETGGKIYKAIAHIYSSPAQRESIPEDITAGILAKIQPALLNTEVSDSVRVECARLTGMLLSFVSEDVANETIAHLLSEAGIGSGIAPHWVTRQSVAMALSSVLVSSKDLFLDCIGYKPAVAFIARGFKDENESACTAALRFAGRLLQFAADNEDDTIVRMLTQELLSLAQPNRVAETVAVCALEQVRKFAEAFPESIAELVNIVVALCVRARTGAGKTVRKECDLILHFALGFHEDVEEGMSNAQELAEKFNENDAAEFLALCKRSVAKAKRDKDEE